jgi:hypothetical protein
VNDVRLDAGLETVDRKKVAEVKPQKVDKSVLDELTSSSDEKARSPEQGEDRNA